MGRRIAIGCWNDPTFGAVLSANHNSAHFGDQLPVWHSLRLPVDLALKTEEAKISHRIEPYALWLHKGSGIFGKTDESISCRTEKNRRQWLVNQVSQLHPRRRVTAVSSSPRSQEAVE